MARDPFDDLSDDMFAEFDLPVEKSDTPKGKTAKVAKAATDMLKSTKEGAMKGVREQLRKSFPKSASLVDEVTGTVDDFKKLKEDVSSELSPAVNTLRQIALRVMPVAENVVPKSWYNKVRTKLQEGLLPPEESAERREEAYRSDTIRTSLESIFQGNLGIQQQLMQKQESDRLVDRRLSHVRFKASIQEMSKIQAGVGTISNFLTGSYTGYLKKSLELKYQSLFVMRDIHKAVVTIAKVTENRLEEIKHNTSLPEIAKLSNSTQTGPRTGAMASMNGARAKSYSEFVGSFRNTFMENIRKGVMTNVKASTRQYLPMLDMSSSMMDMMGIEKWSPLSIATFLLGQGGYWLAKRKTNQVLGRNEWLTDLVEGRSEFLKERITNRIQKWGAQNRNHPLLGWLAQQLPQYNRQSIRNSMLEGANEAVPFDNTTRQTIVEVLPRHLERIGNFTEALYQKLAPDVPLNKMTFNIYQRKLTSIKEAREDLFTREMGSEKDRSDAMDRSLGTLKAILTSNQGNRKSFDEKLTFTELFNKHKKNIKRFLINSASSAEFFDPNAIKAYVNSQGADSEYITKVFIGIPSTERLELAQLLMSMVEDPRNGNRINRALSDRISNEIIEKTRSTNIQDMFSRTAEGFGQSQLFEGVADYKKGVQTQGLYDILAPDFDQKVEVPINPKTGQAYTKEEARKLGLYYSDSTEESSERYHSERLKRLLAIEANLRRNSRKRGTSQDSVIEQLDDAGLGGVAHLIPEGINQPLTKVRDKLTSVWNKMKDSFGSGMMSRATDLYNKTVKQPPVVESIKRVSDTRYIITAVDDRYQQHRETLDLPNALPFGVMPTEEIRELARKMRWKFDENHPKLTFIELKSTTGAPSPTPQPEPAPAAPAIVEDEPPYVYTGKRKNYSLSISGIEESKKPSKPTTHLSTRRGNAEEEPIPFDRGTRRSIIYDIPERLKDIYDILRDWRKKYDEQGGSGKPKTRTKISLDPSMIGPDGLPTDSNKPRNKIGFGTVQDSLGDTTSGSSMGLGSVVFSPNTRTTTGAVSHRKIGFDTSMFDAVDQAVETAREETVKAETPVKKTVRQKIKDTTAKLVDSFPSKEDLLSYIPEDLKEQVGSIYTNCVSKKESLGKFLNQVGTQIKASPAQKKVLTQLKEISTVIPDQTTRKEYVGKILSKLVHYKEIATDNKKRKEFLTNIHEEMTNRLGKIREEIEQKGIVKTVKDTAKDKSNGLFKKLRAYWRLFRRSKAYKWISTHIPEDAKKDLKTAWGDVKEGWDWIKSGNKKKNKIDPKVLEATQLSGFGDEGEFTPEDTLRSAGLTPEQPDQKEAPKTSVFERMNELFPKDKTPANTEVKTPQNELTFFQRLRQRFKRKGKIDPNVTQMQGSGDEGEPTPDDIAKSVLQNKDAEQPAAKPKGPSIFSKMKDMVKGAAGIKFEGDPESKFHQDFRTYASVSVGVLNNIAARVGAKGSGGLVGSILRGIGKTTQTMFVGYTKLMGATLKAYGAIGKGLLYAVGKIGPSLISGTSRVLATSVKVLAGAVKNVMVKPAIWAGKKLWQGAKWVGKETWSGVKNGWGGIKRGWGWLRGGTKSQVNPVNPSDVTQLSGSGDEGEYTPEDIWNNVQGGTQEEKRPGIFARMKSKVMGFLTRPKFVDLYEKDKVEAGNPLLSAKQQEEGAFYEDNSPVKDSYSIDRPVFITGEDGKPKCVITKEQLEHGLVDVTNKPLSGSKKATLKEQLDRRGFLGWAKTTVEWTKSLVGGIKDFFSGGGSREGKETEVPALGRKMGIDLLLTRVSDIFNLLKEDFDARKQKELEAEKAARDAANREASMDAEEQLAAARKNKEEQTAKTEAEKVAEGMPTATTAGGGEEEEGGGGLIDDAIDAGKGWLKKKAINFARNKIAARGLKLLRKTKWGRALTRSKAGKWALKGINKVLAKPGSVGKVAQAAGKLGKVGGALSKVGGVAAKATPFLGKAASFAGKAAPWAALAGVGIGAAKGFSASRKEDEQYAQELGNENVFWRSLKTAINPIRQGRIIASTVRNTFGLGSDLVEMKSKESKLNANFVKFDNSRMTKLKEYGASEEDLNRFKELYGKSDNDSIREKNKIFKKYQQAQRKKQEEANKPTEGSGSDTSPAPTPGEKVEEATPKVNKAKVEPIKGIRTPSGITIPPNIIKMHADTSDTDAEMRSELRTYVNEQYPDKSANARNAAVEMAMREYRKTIKKPTTTKTSASDFGNTAPAVKSTKPEVTPGEVSDPSNKTEQEPSVASKPQTHPVKSTKPGTVVTQATVQDEQVAKQQDSATTYVNNQQRQEQAATAAKSVSAEVTNAAQDALLQATTAGNQDLSYKLGRLIQLMEQQIVVTADSKVASEKLASDGAVKSLEAAMQYANGVGKKVQQSMNRPAPRPAPISVMKPSFA